jgi:hydrogenase maturation protease
MKKVLIGGIGNVLLGDDGVGPYVLQLLAARYDFDDGVEIVDLGTPALDLLNRISGRDAVIFVDSVANEAEPGSVTLYHKADITRLRPAVRMDPHSPALVDTLLSAGLFGVAPDDVLLVGVTPESCDVGCSLSQSVKSSLEKVISKVLSELDRLGVEYKRRERPAEPAIWWNSAETAEAPLAG